MYVTKGRSGRKGKCVTPGSQYPEYTLRTTWQWSEKLQQWQCQERRKKWKLLSEPHSDFDGNKVSAIQVFNAGDNLHLAKIASRGTLLVDTGACSSVCRPEAFPTAALDTEAVEELYTVDNTPLKGCGEIRHSG